MGNNKKNLTFDLVRKQMIKKIVPSEWNRESSILSRCEAVWKLGRTLMDGGHPVN